MTDAELGDPAEAGIVNENAPQQNHGAGASLISIRWTDHHIAIQGACSVADMKSNVKYGVGMPLTVAVNI